MMLKLLFFTLLIAKNPIFEPRPFCQYPDCLTLLDEFRFSPFCDKLHHTMSFFGTELPFKLDLTLFSTFGMDVVVRPGYVEFYKKVGGDSAHAFTNAFSTRGTENLSRLGLSFTKPIYGRFSFDGFAEYVERSVYGEITRRGASFGGRLGGFRFGSEYVRFARKGMADSSVEAFHLKVQNDRVAADFLRVGSKEWFDHIGFSIGLSRSFTVHFEGERFEGDRKFGAWLDLPLSRFARFSLGMRRNSPYLKAVVEGHNLVATLGYRGFWNGDSVKNRFESELSWKFDPFFSFEFDAVADRPDGHGFTLEFAGGELKLDIPLLLGIESEGVLGTYTMNDSVSWGYQVAFRRTFRINHETELDVRADFYGMGVGQAVEESSGELRLALTLFESVKVIWRRRFDGYYTFTISANFID